MIQRLRIFALQVTGNSTPHRSWSSPLSTALPPRAPKGCLHLPAYEATLAGER